MGSWMKLYGGLPKNTVNTLEANSKLSGSNGLLRDGKTRSEGHGVDELFACVAHQTPAIIESSVASCTYRKRVRIHIQQTT